MYDIPFASLEAPCPVELWSEGIAGLVRCTENVVRPDSLSPSPPLLQPYVSSVLGQTHSGGRSYLPDLAVGILTLQTNAACCCYGS